MGNTEGHIMWKIVNVIIISIVVAFLTTLGYLNLRERALPLFDTPYHMIMLSNGTAYYGQVEKSTPGHVILSQTYYVQQQVNQKTRERSSLLIKRGKEWHQPDRMLINRDHIVLMEPVYPDSQVSELIIQAK